MRLRNAASMPRVLTRQPDTARTAFTDHIARRQRASMQHSLSAKPCGETSRFAEHHSTQPYTLAWRNLIPHRGAPLHSYFCALPISHPPWRDAHPWQYRPHPSSTILTRGLVTAASTQRVQACNPDTVRAAVGP